MTVDKDDVTKFSTLTGGNVTTSGTYFVNATGTATVTADNVRFIVEDGKSLTVSYSTGAHTVSIAIGSEKTDGDFQYDSETLISYTTASGSGYTFAATAASGSTPGYYTVTNMTNGAIASGVVVKATPSTPSGASQVVKVYSLNADGVNAVLTHTSNDKVSVVSAGSETFETDVSITYVYGTGAGAVTNTSIVKTTGSAAIATATNLEIGINTTSNSLALNSNSNGTYEGSIEVKSGVLYNSYGSAGKTALLGKVIGIQLTDDGEGAQKWYPVSGSIAISSSDYNTIVIAQGIETGAVSFKDSNTEKAALGNGFTVNEMTSNTAYFQLIYDSASKFTVSGGDNSATTVNWTGTLTVKTTDLELGAGNLGNISAVNANVPAASNNVAKTSEIWGNLELTGKLTVTGHVSTDGGSTDSSAEANLEIAATGSLDVDGKVLLANKKSKLTVDADAKVSANLGVSDTTFLVTLDRVEAMTGNLTIVIDGSSGLMTLTGSYSEGEITADGEETNKITAVGVGGTISGLVIPNATLTPSAALRVNGNFEVATIVASQDITFAKGTARLSGMDTTPVVVTAQKTIVIGKDATLAMSGAGGFGLNLTNTDVTLKVLGKISGGTITNGTSKVYTMDGQDSTKTNYLSGIFTGNVAKAVHTATSNTITGNSVFLDMKDAIDTLGFKEVALGAKMTVSADYEIPAGVLITDTTFGIDVAQNVALTVRGEISQTSTGAITLKAGSGTTGATRTVLNNEGKITAGTGGFITKANTYVVNSGELIIKGTSTASEIVGLFENTGSITLGDASNSAKLTIGKLTGTTSSATEFSNSGTINAYISTIEVVEGCTLENRGKIDSDYDAAKIEGAGTFSNQGDGTVGIAVNTVYVKGVTSTVKIQDDMTQKVTYMSLQSLEVPEGANLKLTNVAKIGVNGKMTINGTLTIQGKLTIAASVYDAQAAELVLNGKIIIADGGELVIGGVHTASANSGIEGFGKLTVADDASITVQNGGKLTILQGTATVKGSLTMDAGSQLTVDGYANSDSSVLKKAGYLKVSGTADLNGYLNKTTNSGLTISNSGIVSIDNGSNAVRESATSRTGAVVIKMAADEAILDIETFLVENQGSTSLTVTDADLYTYTDSSDRSKSKSIPSDNSDEIKFEFDDVDESETSSKTPSKVVLTGTLVIEQSASYKTVKTAVGGTTADKAQYYGMDVSGDVSATFTYSDAPETVKDKLNLGIKTAGTQYFDANATQKVVKNAGGIIVSDELEIGQYVYTTVSTQTDMAGVFTVSGSIDNDASGAQKITAAANSTITVSGSIVSSNAIDVSTGGKVNAVYFITTVEVEKQKITTHYYTTLDVAIEGVQVEGNTADKVVKIIGTVTLLEDVTLPETVKLQFYDSSSKLYVGTSDARATLTAEAEITSVSKQIEVDGTLVFVDKADDKTTKTVSDVTYESGDSRTYTNIYTAVEQAGQSTDAMTITVTKEAGTSGSDKVKLTQNLNIPSNVTLVVGDSVHTAGLMLMDGVTLTIDGVLKTSQDVTAETKFAVNAMDVESSSLLSSAVVVNGKLMVSDSADSVSGIAYTGSTVAKLTKNANIAGAYYSVQGWYVVSNIDDALEETAVTSDYITVYGPVVGSDGTVTAGDTFKGVTVSNEPASTVALSPKTVDSSLTMTSLTLASKGQLVMTGAFTGTVLVGENSTQFAAIKGVTAAESSGALVLTGSVSINSTLGQSLTVSAGTVNLGSSSNFAVSSGTLKIASGAIAKVGYSNVSVAKLNVAGTLQIPAGKTLTVTGQLDVSGMIDTEEATASANGGSLVISGVAYVGIAKSDFYKTGAAASISGPLTLNSGASMFVASGAAVEQDMSAYAKTEVYNGGSLWFTAYANGTTVTMTLNKAPVTNAVLSGWAKTEGGDAITSGTSTQWTFTIGDNSKLYSVVDTFIYKIVIKADQGIGDLYLNGNIMSKGTIMSVSEDSSALESYYAYYATVEAGDYTVTCKLANGFSGTPVLKDTTGKTVSNNKFSVSGDAGTTTFQLTGVEASGYVQPTEQKDNGLTVTDYLLIVLVILVVILAVIVALRLMRS